MVMTYLVAFLSVKRHTRARVRIAVCCALVLAVGATRSEPNNGLYVMCRWVSPVSGVLVKVSRRKLMDARAGCPAEMAPFCPSCEVPTGG